MDSSKKHLLNSVCIRVIASQAEMVLFKYYIFRIYNFCYSFFANQGSNSFLHVSYMCFLFSSGAYTNRNFF